ncbi:uncharacterized protein LOC131361449 [Hemibagrus wyckioides]|uniref:uncharacterized protein LOC131361449 n=1 Tax=Hemibagrus wyckioides TaxID=337641 RepID=UPI00266C2258|nr:uncharacterized protein LOC131361449 [Hemibagrus wyckioides]
MNYHHYSKEPCDAIIEAGGVYFPVHQQTMLDLSPTFFSDLFSKGPTEFSVYTVHNVAVNIMRSIIQYAYSKQINITRRNMKDLLAVAEYLYVGDIVQLCKQLPEKQHCEEDSCEMTESPTTHFWPDVPPWERSLLYKLGVFPPSAYEPNASPPSAYEPNVIPPSAYEPNVIPPSAYEPNVIPPSAYEPNVIPPSAYAPSTNPPSAYVPCAYAPSAYGPFAYPPNAYGPFAYPPNAYGPFAYPPNAYGPFAYPSSAYGPFVYAPSAYAPCAYAPSAYGPFVYAPSAYAPCAYAPSAYGQFVYAPIDHAPSVYCHRQQRIVFCYSSRRRRETPYSCPSVRNRNQARHIA